MNQRDIAKLAGVSTATISRVINNSDQIAPETLAKVKDVIAEYGYVPNAVARNLKTASTKTIGYVVPDIRNPFFTSMLAGFEEMCYAKGYDIVFANTDENLDKEEKVLKKLLGFRVDGLLAVFVDTESPEIRQYVNMNTPIVYIDRKPIQAAKLEHDTILIDNFDGMFQIVKHLVELGHKDIAILYGTQGITPGNERLEGFYQAMEHFKVQVNPEYVVPGKFNEEGSYQAIEQLLALKKRPSAVIATNNLSTMGAYRALIDHKIKIGDEISLVGFDDFPFAAHLNPPITVLKRPTTEVGRIAAELLLKRIEQANEETNPVELRLPTALCVRQSTNPPRKGKE